MGRLIDADELNKCIVDRITMPFVPINKIQNAPTVEAIPKDQYENRLKADLEAILVELQLEIEELDTPNNGSAYIDCVEIIQQKINKLKGESKHV